MQIRIWILGSPGSLWHLGIVLVAKWLSVPAVSGKSLWQTWAHCQPLADRTSSQKRQRNRAPNPPLFWPWAFKELQDFLIEIKWMLRKDLNQNFQTRIKLNKNNCNTGGRVHAVQPWSAGGALPSAQPMAACPALPFTARRGSADPERTTGKGRCPCGQNAPRSQISQHGDIFDFRFLRLCTAPEMMRNLPLARRFLRACSCGVLSSSGSHCFLDPPNPCPLSRLGTSALLSVSRVPPHVVVRPHVALSPVLWIPRIFRWEAPPLVLDV